MALILSLFKKNDMSTFIEKFTTGNYSEKSFYYFMVSVILFLSGIFFLSMKGNGTLVEEVQFFLFISMGFSGIMGFRNTVMNIYENEKNTNFKIISNIGNLLTLLFVYYLMYRINHPENYLLYLI